MRKDDTPVKLCELDIRTLGCQVERRTARWCRVWEPLSWTAPSVARPWFCGVDTVIFHVWPYVKNRRVGGFREWERRRTLLPWGAEFLFDGLLWNTSVAYVCRRRGGWWMHHTAFLKKGQDALLPGAGEEWKLYQAPLRLKYD